MCLTLCFSACKMYQGWKTSFSSINLIFFYYRRFLSCCTFVQLSLVSRRFFLQTPSLRAAGCLFSCLGAMPKFGGSRAHVLQTSAQPRTSSQSDFISHTAPLSFCYSCRCNYRKSNTKRQPLWAVAISSLFRL